MKKRLRFLVSAGPTREYIDPVRFISNPSTGMMGYAVAEAAHAAGHEVVLVSGPVSLAAPTGVEVVPVVSALEMRRAVLERLGACDVLVMTAAVGDYRPARRHRNKMHKTSSTMTLKLVRNPDILREAQRRVKRQVVIGFAAETDGILASAERKLAAKGLDMIVANDVARTDAGFGRGALRAWLLYRDGHREDLGLCAKGRVARHIVRAAGRMAKEKAADA